MSGPSADTRVPPRDGRPALDLARRVHAHLGLIFDAVTLDAAATHLRECAVDGTRCFFSTPNINFTIAAMRDPGFRDSVLQSDLSVADGQPVVALARWLNVPLPERVAGSDLFDRLWQGVPRPAPLRVFFFGGEDGVAERAARQLDARALGLSSAGCFSPGFGSVESMSSPDIIERINAAAPAFLVVSLGAKKGQAWIQRNRARLHAPLISHLGAVVNFVAGHVRRAPRWLQLTGLEWLWRIGREPSLWRRYFDDGMALMRWIVSVAGPRRRLARREPSEPARLSVQTPAEAGAPVRLTLSGTWVATDTARLRQVLAQALSGGRDVSVDLAAVRDVDSEVLGLLALVHGWQNPLATIVTRRSELSARLADRVQLHGMQFLFEGSSC
jgi:N-acetylglucosaminyldiphosphoundecaprenol N-acetyl-beta-D-mannosaminyltransferase